MTEMTYTGVGVDYEAMDPFKRMAQNAARETHRNLHRFGFSEVEWTRGESAYLIETSDSYLAHVEEGLGTKNLVADVMYRITGKSYYDSIAQDTVATIVNDIITLGALPVSVAMHLAAGSSDWFNDEKRSNDLIQGWKQACLYARTTWSGGETPTLKDIISPQTIALAGSAIGIINPKEQLIQGNIKHGDAIIFLGSSGIHANGLTLARQIANQVPLGYRAILSDKRHYGEALLDPTIIYVPLIEDCLNANIEIRYAIHITGHGWRKLMRLKEPFVYVIERIPEPQPVFYFIQENGPVSDEEMYATFNMGAGFALYVPEKEVALILEIAKRHGIRAFLAGHIEKRGEEKKVVILPKNLEYDQTTLVIR